MNNPTNRLALAMALSLSMPVFPQQGSDSAELEAPARPLRYQSAFADYKPWQDLEPGNWKQLNDNLAPAPGTGSNAGHRSAEPAAPATAPKPSAPAAPAHQEHHMYGGKQ